MKVVLDTKKGSTYDDVIASQYHFPNRYLTLLSEAINDWAIFRRPRDGGEGIAYFGAGRISDVIPDRQNSRHHYALIEDYFPFPSPVDWKPNGEYAEQALRNITSIDQVGVYMRGRSVRPLEPEDFSMIVDLGLRELVDPVNRRRFWDHSLPELDLPMQSVEDRVRRLTNRIVRNASFRKLVCDAYEDRCAVTRMRIINGGGRSEVQAAHIRSVSDGGPDIVQNGIALSATAHWLFDRHLISVDPEFRLLVAHNRVPPEYRTLLAQSESQIHLPKDKRLHPGQAYLATHRERFGAIGQVR